MGQVPQYLLTHPDPEARLDYVESLIDAEGRQDLNLSELRDFSFLRFKYRIMSITSGNGSARAYLVNKMTDSRSSEFEITMARYGLSQLDLIENITRNIVSFGSSEVNIL